MKIAKEAGIIMAMTFLGEALNHFLPFPIPAGVYGLFILLLCLCMGWIRLEQVEATGNFMLDVMPMLFIPAAVGLMESYVDFQDQLVPLLVTVVVSTVVVMGVTGAVAQLMIRSKNGKGGSTNERTD